MIYLSRIHLAEVDKYSVCSVFSVVHSDNTRNYTNLNRALVLLTTIVDESQYHQRVTII